MKSDKEKVVREYIEDYVPSFTPCMGTETSERFIETFGKKMGLRRLDDDNLDAMQTAIGFTLNEKEKQEFLKIWMEIFKRVMNEYIVVLKRAKSEEEKEYIKKNGIKRKPQLSENIKKKSKRK